MTERVVVDGVHLSLGGAPFRVRGVTYGSFLPRGDGQPFPESAVVGRDFAAMAKRGLNTVRTYTPPPIDVVELAEDHGLRVLVGLDYTDWRMEPAPGRRPRLRVLDAGRRAVDSAIEWCHTNPSVLAISVGNEVPSDLVRLHGASSVSDVLADLVGRIHEADPDLPTTYVSFPTTEYLDVDGQDLVCFNVFLEEPAPMKRYLRHLLALARDRPLIITELGLAGDVHGPDVQARTLDWQLRLVDETGCAGATVFAWTDEWGVAGEPVEGWGFGLTDRERNPKPALDVVHRWAMSPVRALRSEWPSITVVVCAYNEERTLAECLESLARCDYPALEVVVCDDGSTDGTAAIAQRFPFRYLPLVHGGLSVARNAGLAAATGELVAYLDADAACHVEWPYHLALAFESPTVLAAGGPNLPFAEAPLVERAVALSPGGPVEVLLSDDRAEHVPGCNMVFRRHALSAIGGFEEAYTAAGDDVDICWKLLERGGEIAFAPAAQVRHHRRRTVRSYLRQQRGYGRAECMLSGAHRHRFNRLGQARWSGVIYGGAPLFPRLLRPLVYHGQMGLAPFQPVIRRRAETATMWIGALLPLAVGLALLGIPLAVLSPWWLLLTGAAIALPAGYALGVAASLGVSRRETRPYALRLLVGLLHALQPFVRLWGRIRARPLPALARAPDTWSGDREAWLRSLGRRLEQAGSVVRPARPHQDWDLVVAAGPFVAARLTTAVLWQWEPATRVSWRPRAPLLLLVAVIAVAAWVAGPVAALALSAALLLLVCFEAARLRSRIGTAIDQTTRAAAAAASG